MTEIRIAHLGPIDQYLAKRDRDRMEAIMLEAKIADGQMPLISYYRGGDGGAIRWRHPEPRCRTIEAWREANRLLYGEIGTAFGLTFNAGLSYLIGDGHVVAIEIVPEGYFVWKLGFRDKAVLVPCQTLSAHERIAAIGGFLERRDLHGDCLGTGIEEMEQGKLDAMRSDIEGNDR